MPVPTVHVLKPTAALQIAQALPPPMACQDVFATLPWFELLATAGFPEPVKPLWAVVRHEGQSFALPLIPGAAGLEGLSNYYSSLFGPVGDCSAASPESWQALGRQLRAMSRTAVLRMQPLEPDGAFLTGMAAGLRAAGYLVDTFFCFGNWYLPVEGRSAADHFSERPSALRNSVERGRRRLDRGGAWDLQIHTSDADDLERGIAEFESVYLSSWKQPEPCPGFMPGLIRTAAAEGWLRLGVLRHEGRAIAAQVWLVCGGTANIYKLAYVDGYQRFSPGSVLTAALMAHVIDADHVREVDYLTGDDAYKRDWMTQRRERWGIVAFDPLRPAGFVGATRHFGGRLIKSVRAVLRSVSTDHRPE